MQQTESGLWAPSTFKKSTPPPLGPIANATAFDSSVVRMPGGATLMFDLDKLTLADYRSMRYHPQVNASLSLITFMLHQLDWHIECEDSKIAEVVEENVRLIWTRLVRALSQSFWAGYSPSILEWENANNGKHIFINKILDLPPEECQVNWREVEPAYKPQRVNGITHLPPKVKIYDGINKYGLGYPIPAELTLWYPILMENNDFYGRKLLKSAFQPWYFSMLMHLFANRYFERFGEPTPVGRAPFDDEFKYKRTDGETVSISGKQAMENILATLRSRGNIVLPSDRDPTATSSGGRSEYLWDVEYLESQMRGADFERYLARLDEEISLSIFTPMLLMRSGDTGSHNLGVQHTQTWLWSLNALAGDLKEYIDRYICERIKAYNFSEKAPKCHWVPRKLGKDNPETIRTIINMMISQGYAKPNIEEMGVALGMKLEEIEQVAEDPNANPNAPAADDRGVRPERNRSGSGPRRVGEPLATGREIAARIGGQVKNAWSDLPNANLSMGFRRRFHESLVAEGVDHEAAETMTLEVYSKMETWLKTAASLGSDEFSSPQDFVSLFERRLTTEIENLATR